MGKQNPGAKMGKHFRSVIAELKKVAWPTRRETTVYTIVVIVTVVVVAALIGVFDLLLRLIFTRLFLA